MKFKDYGEGWFQMGSTDIFVHRESETKWSVWELVDDKLHRLQFNFRTRKGAGKYYLGSKIRKRIPFEASVSLPVRPKRVRPEHLFSFLSEFKKV